MAISVIGGGNRRTRRKPSTCCKSLTNFITKCCIEYTSPWTGFKLTTLIVIGTDCTDNCKSNYHTIMTTTPPFTNSILNNQHFHIYNQFPRASSDKTRRKFSWILTSRQIRYFTDHETMWLCPVSELLIPSKHSVESMHYTLHTHIIKLYNTLNNS